MSDVLKQSGKYYFAVFFATLLAAAFVSFSGCGEKNIPLPGESADKEMKDSGNFFETRYSEKEQVFESAGTVDAEEKCSVSSIVSAKVLAVNVKPGDRMEKGRELIRLDSRSAYARVEESRAQVEKAKSRLSFLEKEFKRINSLFAEHAATEEELDRVTYELNTAKAANYEAEKALADAEVELSYYSIRAPIEGIVIDHYIEPGELAVPGVLLVKMFNPQAMRVIAEVPEKYYSVIKPGDSLNVITGSGKKITGKITQITPASNPQTRTFSLKISIPYDEELYPGMYSTVSIPAGKEKAMIIPEKGILKIGQLEMVDVITEKGVQRRAVKTGKVFSDGIEIISGINEGEKILLH